MSRLFEVVYWTAGGEAYCRAVMRAIEETGLAMDGRPVLGYHPHYLSYHDTVTLGGFDSMKFLGHLGRPINKTLLIDDNRRSFPLTPRQAVRCSAFRYPTSSKNIFLRNIHLRRARMKLLKLLPLAVGDSSSEGGAQTELDHWRPDDHEQTDSNLENYRETRSALGKWTAERRQIPINPLGKVFAEDRLDPEVHDVVGQSGLDRPG